MPEEYALEVSARWWQRAVAAIGAVERLLVELITNSTDSYKRLRPKDAGQVGNIEITYLPSETGAEIQVRDEAEGISFDRFQRALEYGEDTSGLSQGLPVRGTLGIGLKDVCIAMQGSRLLSIHDGELNECTIYRKAGKPWVKFVRKNEIVTQEERDNMGLKGNGTIVTGFIPKDFLPVLDFKTLHRNLCHHYMLRKINQSPRYRLSLKSGKNETAINYEPPEGETILQKELAISHESSSYHVQLTIKRSSKDLTQTGEFRDGGLGVVYNEDAVADCSLFGFDSDPHAKKFFGEIEIQNFSRLLLDQTKSIVDERRRGLDKRHAFVIELTSLVARELDKIIDRERKAEVKLRQPIIKSEEHLDRVLRELNTIARSELREIGELDTLPLDWRHPDYFRFYHDTLGVPEYESTSVGLGINPDKIPDRSEIFLTSNDPRVEVNPSSIIVDYIKAKGMLPLIREKVIILGKGVGVQAKITAKLGETIPPEEMIVNVLPNPLLSPTDGFAFIPDEITMSEKRTKYATLVIEIALIRNEDCNSISLASSNANIHCQSEIRIPSRPETLAGKVARLQIPVKGKGIGEVAEITASYRDKKAKLGIKIEKRDRESHGLFGGFDYVNWETLELISDYDPKTGYILVNRAHPSFKKHENIGWSSLRLFVVNVITRKVCERITSEKVQKGAFPSFSDNPGTFMTEVFLDIEHLYHKYGHRLYDLLEECVKKPG